MPDADAIPVARTSFAAEQARRRRQARLWGLLCLALAAGIGAALSTIAGPLLLILAAAGLRLLAWLGLAPTAMRHALHGLEGWTAGHLRALDRGFDLLAAAQGPGELPMALAAMLGGAGLLLPGMLAAMLLWAGLARFYRRSAAASAAADLRARPPRREDAEEHQLGNILAELALAAGQPVPRLLLVDAPEPNAGAFGASHREAVVIATRGLLERLDRRQTQGVVAHLLAATGQGDLRLAAAVEAVLGTVGAMVLVFDLPFRRGAWTTLRDLLLALAGGLPAAEADRLRAGLAASASAGSMDAMNRVLGIADRWPPFGALLVAPLIPWVLLTLAQKLLVALWMLFVFGWPLGLLWRTRRYRADAGAVELLRDPEALAAALRRIDAAGLPPGGGLQELGLVHAPQQGQGPGFRERASLAFPLTPPIRRRLARLAALGAEAGQARSLGQELRGLAALRGWKAALVIGLTALLLPLTGALAVMVGLLVLGAALFSLMGGAALASLVLRL
ncbi:MAG: M48 family metalloprotease [Paracraurococcus sp.]